jgi:hypothetical protein
VNIDDQSQVEFDVEVTPDGVMREPQAQPAPRSARQKGKQDSSSTAWGIFVYVALVLVAYLLGRCFPSTRKELPLPTSTRTICKRPPKDFDPAQAKGKTALIIEAAGFIGSHVARRAALKPTLLVNSLATVLHPSPLYTPATYTAGSPFNTENLNIVYINCRFCSEQMHMDVVGLEDFEQGAANVPFLGDARLIKGDLLNSTFLRGLFSKYKFDVVYHLSDQPGDAAMVVPATALYTSNLVGTVNLVTEVIRAEVPHFVLLSSTSVYGNATGASSELSPARPIDPFGVPPLPTGPVGTLPFYLLLAASQNFPNRVRNS